MNSEKLIKSAEPEFQLLPFSVRAKDQVPRHPDLLATGHHREAALRGRQGEQSLVSLCIFGSRKKGLGG